MRVQRRIVPAGFNVGAIASAVLLAFGIASIVSMLEEPVAAAIVPVIDWIIHAGRFDVMTLSETVPWPLTIYSGVSGIIFLVVGIKLAAWVTKDA
jgi:hypothetical protein